MHSTARGLVLSLALAALGGCPSYTQIPDPARAEIDAARQGELLWLKQSLYYGQFYDDDRYTLVYPRRFEEISYLRTVEGDIISPPPASGIIPAGTRVRVEKIEWPTGEAVFRRPLYTPRYATWVVLRVARDRGDTYLERDTRHILLLPGGIPDPETFDTWFGAFFSDDDPNAWLMRLPVDVRQGVFEKRPVIGMDYDTLTAAMGYPDRLSRDGGDAAGTTEVAIFGPVSVVLERGVVVRVSDPLAEQPGARPAPDAPTSDAPSLPSETPSSGDVTPPPDAPSTEPSSTEGTEPSSTEPPSTEPTTAPPSESAPAEEPPATDPMGAPVSPLVESLVDGAVDEGSAEKP
jgi:hypothetical protein